MKDMPKGAAPWYQDAVFYRLPVRAFHDSNADGRGDFLGLTQKLGYARDLGVTALWLLPFYTSPLRDDGFDVADYLTVHPDYGDMAQWHAFLDGAHSRGLRVIADLVLGHTSDQHAWFRRARAAAPGSSERDFYVWSDDPGRYAGMRVVFADAESANWAWDPVARAYYWHRFYSCEPDLNYDNPAVQAAMLEVVDFWLDQGLDGFGLAAVPYLFEREGTDGENLPETHSFLKRLRAHVDERHAGRVLIAEANAWPEEAAAYFGQGDECHMAVAFPLAPRLFSAVRAEDRFPIVDILEQTSSLPEGAQWATFLRDHDELSLQMVTDEQRDYLLRAYAPDPQARVHGGIRRRLASLLDNDRRQVELLNSLLFSLPGSPVIYYGDEIGMGDSPVLPDRAGLRTPMPWGEEPDAGFSGAGPARLETPAGARAPHHFETVNVATQERLPGSLLSWMRRLIATRKGAPALARGTLATLPSGNRKVLSFIRRPLPGAASGADETVLVVANLSRFTEYVQLDLSEFRGIRPVEAMGRKAFPEIGAQPYLFMLGPYACHWFLLPARGEREPAQAQPDAAARRGPASLPAAGAWDHFLLGAGRGALEAALPDYLRPRRWFRGKARAIRRVEILDAVPVLYAGQPGRASGTEEQDAGEGGKAYVTPVRVDYSEGDSEMYVLPVTVAAGDRARAVLERAPHAAIAWLGGQAPCLLYDATVDPTFSETLLAAVGAGRTFGDGAGELRAEPTAAFAELRGPGEEPLSARTGSAEQSNTSVIFGNRLIMKLYRRIEEGVNPDLEVTRFLTERTAFRHIAPVAGALEYRPAGGRPLPGGAGQTAPLTLGIVQGFVANQGDAWEYTLGALGTFIQQAAADGRTPPETRVSTGSMLRATEEEPPALARALIGEYLEAARLLGRRTAEMHLALASDSQDPDFAPEPFTMLYQRSLYQSWRALQNDVFDLLRQRSAGLPEPVQERARVLLGLEDRLRERFRAVTVRKADALRMRTHGDYHLGQVLYTGDDFVIIDFEGEPVRPLNERRFKRGALRDVAGMLRSFQYAAYGKALFDRRGREETVDSEHEATLDAWARFWQLWACGTYLKAYLEVAGAGQFLPRSRQELAMLLDAYLLEKATYELGYELNNRPDWVMIPVQSILQLLQG